MMAQRLRLASERLAFEGPNAAYHAYRASQHVAHYAAAQRLVAGKRVLDAACGEGFGAYLLEKWGATHVLGIDIAEAAIARARRYFGSDRCEFVRGDVAELRQSIGDRKFDVIVSFDTIEHTEDPDAFLRQLKTYVRDGAVLLIGCANIPALSRAGETTEFHRTSYTFEAFRAMTESELGRADQWLWTTPLLGEACIPHADAAIRRNGGGAFPIIETTPVGSAVLLPSQDDFAPTAETIAGYLGVWHAEIDRTVAVSVQSLAGHLQPYQEIDHCKQENARLRMAVDDHEARAAEIKRLSEEVEILRAAADEHERIKTEWFAPQLELRAAETKHLSEEIGRLRAAVDEHERVKTEWFAPQLEQRAAEIKRLSEEIERLRAAADEHERIKTEWFAPQLEQRAAEIERLSAEIARLRITIATGEASFQAERRRVLFYSEDSSEAYRRIIELQRELARVSGELQNLKSSHSYALMQLYIRLHDRRVLGWPVRLAKRLAKRRLRLSRFAA